MFDLRQFKNCKFVFSMYENTNSKLEVQTENGQLLLLLTVEGTTLMPGGMILKNTPVTEAIIKKLFHFNLIHGYHIYHIKNGEKLYLVSVNYDSILEQKLEAC